MCFLHEWFATTDPKLWDARWFEVYCKPGAAGASPPDRGLVESDSRSALRRLILANFSWKFEIPDCWLESVQIISKCTNKSWASICCWRSSCPSMVLVVLHLSNPRPTVSESTDMSFEQQQLFKYMTITRYKVVHIFFRARFAQFRAHFAQFRARFAPKHVAKNYQNHPTSCSITSKVLTCQHDNINIAHFFQPYICKIKSPRFPLTPGQSHTNILPMKVGYPF